MSADPGRRCPVCGALNRCEVALGRGTCWCFATRVDPALRDLLESHGIEEQCLCGNCAAGRVPSPCVATCRLDESGQHCIGCARTLAEIGTWAAASSVERAWVWLRLRGVDGGADRPAGEP